MATIQHYKEGRMSKPRDPNAKVIRVTYSFDVPLIEAFSNLARANGITMHEAIRRSLMYTVNQGRIPGIEPMRALIQDASKLEQAVPVYDGERAQQRKASSGLKAQVTHAE